MRWERGIARGAVACAVVWGALCLPAFAVHSRLTDARGETVFSQDFLQDYQAAEREVLVSHSAEPMLALLKKYTGANEQAELELTLGITYGQRTGVVDPAKAVLHFSNALRYELPERTYIEILMWRGNALEMLEKRELALRDYLRGLLACSYHDLSEAGDLKPPSVDLDIHSDDPVQRDRQRDYRVYRNTLELRRLLSLWRFHFVEAVRRIRTRVSFTDDQLRSCLEELTPDTSRYELIVNLVNAPPSR